MRKITRQLSVLLVDDDFDDRQIFSEALSEILENFSFTNFKGGKELIDFLSLRENQVDLPDIIFLDINMPLIDGIETLSILRNELKIYQVPIAMYSTSTLESDVAKAFMAGANIYIKKPSSFDKLKETLHRVLHASLQKDDLSSGNFLFAI